MALAKDALHSTVWITSSGYINMVTSFGGNIVLARILLPDDFGVFALASSLLTLLFMFAGFGSQEAIVQCRDEKIQDLIPTAFWISIFIGLALAALGTLTGFILRSYYEETVVQLIVVLSWLNLLSVIGNAYSAILQRELSYKLIAVTGTIATVVSFVVAGVVAWQGAGLWSLVVRQTVAAGITLLGVRWASHYRLTLAFDRQAARWIWNFGWRMMVSRIAEVLFGRLDNLVVGTIMGTVRLGHYSLAYRLAFLGQQLTQGPIQSVIFSTFSAVQKSPENLRYGFERFYYWLWRVVIPVGLVVLLMGKGLVVLIYGDKWNLAGTIFQSMFFFLTLLPLHGGVKNFLIGSGHINMVLRTRVIQLIFFIPAVIAAAYWGDLIAVVWVVTVSVFLSWLLMARSTSKVIDVKWSYLVKAPIVSGVFAAICGLSVAGVSWPSLLVMMLAQGTMIIVTYCGMLYLVDRAALVAEWRIIRTALS